MTTKAGSKEWIGLAVLVLPVLLISMDLTVLFFALPRLAADLEPTGTELLWIVDIYGFLLAGLLITMGTIGDRIGRRRLLLIGAAAFSVASILAAYSESPTVLIATRALLGIAGATLAPSTLALIRNMFHDAGQRRTAIAVWTGGFSGGAALGPILGGFLLEHFWWGSVFLINVPVMLLLLILGPLLLPEFRSPQPGRFDLVSAVLSLGAVLPVIYGIKKFASDGAGWIPLASIVVGLVVGTIFVRRQQKQANPMLDLRLFSERKFSAALGVNTVAVFAMVGFALFTSQYLQMVLGMGPLTAALWTLPAPAGAFVGAIVAAQLVRRVRPGAILAGALLVIAAGLLIITQASVESGLAIVVVGATAMAAGVGAVGTLCNDIVVASAPPERAGAASAISETTGEFGGALGIAVLGSIGAAVYRRDMSGQAEQETLGAAIAVAERLPGESGAALVEAGKAAFTHGMQVTAVVAAVLMVVGAVLSVALLKKSAGDRVGAAS